MDFKQLTLKNEEEIKGVIRDAFSAPPWNDRWDNEEVFHQYLQDVIDNKNSLSLGVLVHQELVGIALGRLKHWFDGIEYCIDDFCIRTSWQGEGIGSKFLSYIKEYARQQGFKQVSLCTKRSAAAYGFYKKNEFKEPADRVCLAFEIRNRQ